MKVIAQTAALQEALTLVGSIVQARTPKPVLQCVKLVAADNSLTLLSTDLEAGARFQINAVQIEEEGEALIPASRLMGIVRESSDESLTIETEKDACHIRGKGTHFKVFGYDPAEYPAVAEFAEAADFTVSAGTLGQMIGKTLFATAKAHSHYAISGVLWEASDKKLKLVATDGHRLAMAKGQLKTAATKEVSAIVPAKLMNLVQRITTDDDQDLEVKIEENQILVRTPRAVLVSSLVQGNFPKYEDVVPKDATRTATIQTDEFSHRIRQAALLTNEESRGVKLSFSATEATLTSRAPEAGEAEVTFPIVLEGDGIEMGFNPAFLSDALKVINGGHITFEMTEPSRPAMIKTGSDFLYVIMPVSLD